MTQEQFDEMATRILAAKAKRQGRELTEDEINETRAFAGEAVAEIIEAVAEEIPEVDETVELEAAPEEELTNEEVIAAMSEMEPDEVIASLDGLDGEEATEILLALGDEQAAAVIDAMSDEDFAVIAPYLDAYVPQVEPIAENRAYSAQDFQAALEAERATIRAQARKEGEDAARSLIEEERRSFAMAEDLEVSVTMVDTLVSEGKLVPAKADLAKAILIASVSQDQTPTRSFAAADLGEFGERPLSSLLIEFLRGLPVVDGFADTVAGVKNDEVLVDARSLKRSFAGGGTVDEAAATMREAKRIQTEQNVSFSSALEILRGNTLGGK